jgi:hypothetical protein
MIKLKSLKKKLLRLEARLQKDARKLSKLQSKVDAALRTQSTQTKSPIRIRNGSEPARLALPAAKKKRQLTPAGRAKLSAMMKARWAAKRAGTVPFVEPQRVEA